MEIIFFHAGEYKEKSDKHGKPVRVLTAKAEKLTARAAQGISRLLPRKTKIEVWCTLTPHQSQTAEIIADELDIKMKFVNAIGHEDMHDLLKVLSEHAKEKCIIIVGDEPNLSFWAGHLANVKLPLSEYCAAGFMLNPPEYTETEFLWFTSAAALPRIR